MMKRRAERVVVMALVTLFGAGCSSGSGAKSGADAAGTDGGDGADGADPMEVRVATSFVLATAPFTVALDGESTQCVVLDLGNAEPIHIGEIETTLSDAVYELRIAKVSGTVETTPTPCAPFGDLYDAAVTPLVFAKNKNEALLFPDGVGYTLAAHQLLRFELHAASSTGAAMDATATATFVSTPAATFQHEAGLLWVEPFGVRVAAHESAALGPIFFPLSSSLGAISIFRRVGYTHKLGVGVEMALATSAADPAPVSIYAPPAWDFAHPMVIIETSSALMVPSPGGLTVKCSWNNTAGDSLVTRGPSVDDERCAGVISYYPAAAAHTCIQMGVGVGVNLCCPGGAGC